MESRSTAPLCADVAPPTARRSRRAAAAIVTTLGAAALAGTAFAGSADAASRYAVWDRVADCESSQHWHIDTGNGFYGGLQFSAGTWSSYHGHKYAHQASGATRAEQIEVARRVLAAQGPGAWPVCGPRAGLTRHSGHATHAALPAQAGTPTRTLATKSGTHHGKSHRHHRHKSYTVHSGDTLSAIAHKFHVHGGWKALYRANRDHMHNPNVLRVGQVLRLP